MKSPISNEEEKLKNQSTKFIQFKNRYPRSTSADSSTSHLDELCSGIGSHSCTCDYPDHPNMIKFELSTDEITMNASTSNGSGPANCKDIQALGHGLNGFYIVRFNNKRTKTIYCEFHQLSEELLKESNKAVETSLKRDRISKDLRICGEISTDIKDCTFLYPDSPDIPKFEFKGKLKNPSNFHSREPTSCDDLRAIGYTMKGFYPVRLNAVKIKTVYCDFKFPAILEDVNKVKDKQPTSKTKSRFCTTIGSPPCSCNYPHFPNTLQLELSNDELTKKALTVNGIGPASCNDLESIGHNLNGFYVIRATEKIMKTVFCEFGPNDEVTATITTRIQPSTIPMVYPTQTTLKSDFERPTSIKLLSQKMGKNSYNIDIPFCNTNLFQFKINRSH